MKKLALIVLAILICAGAAFAEGAAGMSFTSDDICVMAHAPDRLPSTFEAWLQLDAAVTGRGGVIIGNYGGEKQCASFEIYENGQPRLYFVQQNGMVRSYIFEGIDIRGEEFVHLAIVRDAKAKTLTCYVNGEPISSLKDKLTTFVPSYPYQLGGDMRLGNTAYFKGALKSVTLYGDARTAEEIAADMLAPDPADEDLIAAYDLSEKSAVITDLSGNGYDINVAGGEAEETVDIASVPLIERPWYQMVSAPDRMPKTIEITFNANAFGANNVLVGNQGTYRASISVEINSGGAPCIYYVMPDGTSKSSQFNLAKVKTGETVRLTIVRDTEAKKVHCYINGVKKDSLKCTAADYVPIDPYGVGGDYRIANEACFSGSIYNVAMYADMRTEAEIAADMTAPDLHDEDLIVCYDLADWGAQTIRAAKGDIALERKTLWLDEAAEPSDYAYTFAVVGDTQYVTRDDPEQLVRLYDYIIDNVEAKNIVHCFGLGDITDENTDAEWKAAFKQIARMDGVLPYSLVRGNHDGGTRFNDLFGEGSAYSAQCVANYQNNYTCTAHTFSAGQLDYLVVVMDHDPTEDMMRWGGEIIERYPDHNVIITTHGYLDFDGSHLIETEDDSHVWTGLACKYPNVVLVLCGHVDADSVVMSASAGVQGNEVVELLIDPQALDYKLGPTGMIAMLYFSEDGTQVELRYYSTVQEKYYKDANQFSFTLNTIQPDRLPLNAP